MLTKKQLFTRGMLDISPHMLSVIPFGIICGAIGVELGFNPYLVYAMSFIIFGGASQIVFLQLLSGGASSLVAVASPDNSCKKTICEAPPKIMKDIA